MVRPESLRVTTTDGHLENKLHGRLHDVVFAGGITKIHVRTEHGAILVVKELTTPDRIPNKGDEVIVSWRCEDTVLLPEAVEE